MKVFKNRLIVEGPSSLRNAFKNELLKLGYLEDSLSCGEDSPSYETLRIFVNDPDFKGPATFGTWSNTGNEGIGNVHILQLPEQWYSALKLASEKANPADLDYNEAMKDAQPFIEAGIVPGAIVRYANSSIYRVVEFPTKAMYEKGDVSFDSYYCSTGSLRILLTTIGADVKWTGWGEIHKCEVVEIVPDIEIARWPAQFNFEKQTVSFGCQTFTFGHVHTIANLLKDGNLTFEKVRQVQDRILYGQ